MAPAEPKFQFVIQSDAKVPKDPAVRTLIRKQAMKEIGLTRRRKGNYGQANRREERQPNTASEVLERLVTAESGLPLDQDNDLAVPNPPSLDSGTSSSDNSSDYSPENLAPEECLNLVPASVFNPDIIDPLLFFPDDNAFADLDFVLPACMPLSRYEATRIKYNVDLQDLSLLTGFNAGSATHGLLTNNPKFLEILMCARQWSYLQFVPALYDNSDCVTAAVDCLIARVRWMLTIKTQQGLAEVYMLYAKALKALQTALSCPKRCQDADVLCATQVISVHEVCTIDSVPA